MTAAQSVTLTELEDGARANGLFLTTEFAGDNLLVTGFETPYIIYPDGDIRATDVNYLDRGF